MSFEGLGVSPLARVTCASETEQRRRGNHLLNDRERVVAVGLVESQATWLQEQQFKMSRSHETAGSGGVTGGNVDSCRVRDAPIFFSGYGHMQNALDCFSTWRKDAALTFKELNSSRTRER